MVRKVSVLSMLICTLLTFAGCSNESKSIYELSAGDVMHKAIKVQVLSFSTELGNGSKEVTSVNFKLNITNIGAESINLKKDIQITAVQGVKEALLTKNTIIESKTLKPKKLGTYEVGFSFQGKGNVQINVEIEGESADFMFTTIHPATIVE
ncbi:MAG: hypothetical protein K0S71_2918 [Clostridia bacterium]|jgi:hypothetical protein|nr:hypothetical protein [Clostridia bacterium]